MRKLHKWELTTTTALAFGLMCSWPVSATELVLKPAFDNSGIRVAAITFLPDWFGEGNSGEVDIDINIDTKWCEDKGYTYGCPSQQAAYETCEHDTNYVKCNKSTWCKNNNYKTSSCSLPSYLDQQCPNGEKLYKGCKENKPQACKDVGYVNTCPSGQKLYNTTNRCSWDSSFGKCCSPTGCPANTGLSGSYGSAGSNDGCGYACYYTCNPNCPSGTTTSNPGGCGGSTTNGCGTKTCYNPYKACSAPADTNSCYWNGNGSYTSSTSCTSFQLYGASATINIPTNGINVAGIAYTFHQGATVEGGPITTAQIWIGLDYLQTTNAVFNVPVTINGPIHFGNASTVVFNKGIKGNYTCRRWRTWDDYTDIACPF